MPEDADHESSAQPPSKDRLAQSCDPIDPFAMARRDIDKKLPKRFYTRAEARGEDGAFAIILDGRVAKTPAKNKLALPTLAAAQALAEEWERQGEILDPAAMPLTRIVNSAIDGVARNLEATTEAIVAYAGADLVCYRAEGPAALVRAQAAAFDPILAFAREQLDAIFLCAEGVMFVTQPEAAQRALRRAVDEIAKGPAGAFALACLHVMTSLTGSALIALAVEQQALTAAEAWRAAHIDEDFQIAAWGADAEAERRRESRWREMEAAAQLLKLIE